MSEVVDMLFKLAAAPQAIPDSPPQSNQWRPLPGLAGSVTEADVRRIVREELAMLHHLFNSEARGVPE